MSRLVEADEGHAGAATLTQRFGSAAKPNIRLRCLVLHGMYRRGAGGALTFVEADPSPEDELHALLQSVVTRPMKLYVQCLVTLLPSQMLRLSD
jgi:hypothetical protein